MGLVALRWVGIHLGVPETTNHSNDWIQNTPSFSPFLPRPS